MRRRWALVGLVVAGNVLLALLPPVLFPHWPFRRVYAALNFGQGSLLGIWVVLGGKPTPWRFVGVVAASAALITLVEKAAGWLEVVLGGGLQIVMWTSVVLQQTMATTLPLVVLRLVGLRVVEGSWGSSAPEAATLQCSLRSLFTWTAATAVLLSAFRYLPRTYFADSLTWQQAKWLGLHALVASVLIWVAMGTRSLAIRIIVSSPWSSGS